MDIQRAFTFPFDDKTWVSKIGIGAVLALLSFLIIPLFVLGGYSIEVARRVMEDDELLPDWDIGKMLADGFVVTVASIIYSLPALVLFIIGGLALGGFSAITGGSDAGVAAGGGILVLMACLAFLYMLALIVITPGVYIQFIRHGNLGACLDYKEVLAITREQIGNIIMVFVALFIVGIGLGFINLVLNFIPCLGQIASIILSLALTPYLQIAVGHLYGQIAKKVDKLSYSEKM